METGRTKPKHIETKQNRSVTLIINSINMKSIVRYLSYNALFIVPKDDIMHTEEER